MKLAGEERSHRLVVHADSVLKRTSRLDLLSYLQERADHFDGVIFYRIR